MAEDGLHEHTTFRQLKAELTCLGQVGECQGFATPWMVYLLIPGSTLVVMFVKVFRQKGFGVFVPVGVVGTAKQVAWFPVTGTGRK